MKYVALLSGGKDSCYNLLHCYKNGHELVAAASLGPQPGTDELDSHMYQTVGQDAIHYVAQALDVPLYRRVITGSAIDLSSEYGSREARSNEPLEADETEDLFTLLKTVKADHPEIEGVSVGAILSNYQRVRVEHVCRRLSLTPLAYLWQRDQRELISEMIAAGLEAILIKVAGAGLGTTHLGKTLAQVQPTLLKLNELYGSHICGEGGEYETLTLDCPLFKRRITLIETETVIHSDNDFATVAYLRVKSATLEEKSAAPIDPAIPLLLDAKYNHIHGALENLISHKGSAVSTPPDYDPGSAMLYFPRSSRGVKPWVIATATPNINRSNKEVSIEEEVFECFHGLQVELGKYSLDISHCASINIFLSSMDYFARVNTVYSTFFGSSPAARACVAIDMHDPFRVRLECVAYAETKPSDRQALHVQGLSYWAPANIGPYSQAVTVHDQRVFISGQIGLLPYNLTLPSPQSLATETALACQHVDRVIEALKMNSGGGWEGHIQLALYWLQNYEDFSSVRDAVQDLDGSSSTLFLGVPALPKGALVEKQVMLHTGRFTVSDDGEIEYRSFKPQVTNGTIPSEASLISWTRSSFESNASAVTVICTRGDVDAVAESQLATQLPELWNSALAVRIFYRPSFALNYPDFMLKYQALPVTPVPCRFVATASHDDWDIAICIIATPGLNPLTWNNVDGIGEFEPSSGFLESGKYFGTGFWNVETDPV